MDTVMFCSHTLVCTQLHTHTHAHMLWSLKGPGWISYYGNNEPEGQSEAANYLFSVEVIFLSHS